ncbi:MAG TPA: hypothetical protein VGX45_04795, partial [Solirubrobacteraceae bacterium]|nr:hypothetical protein [Solirubrobacteraceae bacterium]
SSVPALEGQVFPAVAGSPFTVQVRGSSGWRRLVGSTLGFNGRFDVALPLSGTYRAVYAGLAGPAVAIP